MIPVTKLGGHTIPQVGFGLWQIKDSDKFSIATKSALASGYRHFDTAQVYGNEAMLGEALAASNVSRADLFITTKINVKNFCKKRLRTSFEQSLTNLQTDYVDLLLLHFPVPRLRNSAWQVLEELLDEGTVRSIGVSNYTIKHLKKMKKYAKITPAVNQVELHVFLQQPDLLDYCHTEGIVIEAYSPLAHGRDLDDPVLTQLAKKYDKTPAHIMLRWCVQRGTIPLPKSVTPARIAQNINIFDFELESSDMVKLAKLDRNLRTCWDPTYIP